MIVAKYCYENNIPTLGICCGQNVMARALGGTTKLIKTFYVAFRFHPESLYKVNKDHNKIFEKFIKACNGEKNETKI